MHYLWICILSCILLSSCLTPALGPNRLPPPQQSALRAEAQEDRTEPPQESRLNSESSGSDEAAFQILIVDNFAPELQEAEELLARIEPFLKPLKLSQEQQITVEFKACGSADAFYNTRTDTITMCGELLQLLKSRFNREEAQEAYVFVFLHELSHALIDQLNLPILGGEEDAADAMATVLLLEKGKSALGAILAGISFYELYRHGLSGPWAGSHSLGPQRMFNLVCWASGGAPELLDDPLIFALNREIASARRSCPTEYKQQSDAVEQFLAPVS